MACHEVPLVRCVVRNLTLAQQADHYRASSTHVVGWPDLSEDSAGSCFQETDAYFTALPPLSLWKDASLSIYTHYAESSGRCLDEHSATVPGTRTVWQDN